VVHLDSQAKVSHLGDAATLAAAVTLQQHVAHLQVAVDDLCKESQRKAPQHKVHHKQQA
jgi:hypothetical protein